jgi:2-polyprenyl-3-methyl-5-hydroxy-6-metoxy-1,4-benzoquinol methylase
MADYREAFYKKYRTSLNITENTEGLSNYSLKCAFEYYIKPIQKFSSSCNILDIGCGGGKIIELLDLYGYNNVFGIDISEEQIEYAKSKKLNVKLTDVFSYLSDTKEKYTVIFAVDFVEHFSTDELYRLFNLLSKVLTDDGVIILRTPNAQGLFANSVYWGDLTHRTFFSFASMNQLVKSVGLNVISGKEDGPIKNHILGFPRYFIWAVIKLLLNIVRRISGARKIKYWTDNIYFYITKTK